MVRVSIDQRWGGSCPGAKCPGDEIASGLAASHSIAVAVLRARNRTGTGLSGSILFHQLPKNGHNLLLALQVWRPVDIVPFLLRTGTPSPGVAHS